MAQCAGIRPNGERCKAAARAPSSYCWAHDSRNAEQRRRMASKAASGARKPSREIRDLKGQLEKLASDVLEGHVEKGDAVAVNQIWNTVARLIETERKIREEELLVSRIEALEEAQKGGLGGRHWGT